jgi:hypothetical protein
MNAVLLKEYFRLAMDLQILWNCKYFGTELVLGRMRSVVECLNAFDLPHSRKLVPKIERMLKILHERHFKEFEQFVKGLPADDAEAVSSVIGQIIDSVLGEAEDRFTCILDRTAVSDRIRQLHERLPLNETQILLRNEVIRCMESGAYRSAIVMGWNLAYDFIRTWMFGDPAKREAFDKVLTTKRDRKGQSYATLTEYSQLFRLQESDVLKWSSEANLFNDKVLRALIERLDRRNDYAHPNFKHPDSNQSMGYVIELIAILEDAPFRC